MPPASECSQPGPGTAGMPSLKGEAVCLPALLGTTPNAGGSVPETGLLVTAAGHLGPGRRKGGPGGQGWGPRPQGRVLGPEVCNPQPLRRGRVLQPSRGPGDGRFRVELKELVTPPPRPSRTQASGRRTRHSLLLTEVAPSCDSRRDRSWARGSQPVVPAAAAGLGVYTRSQTKFDASGFKWASIVK